MLNIVIADDHALVRKGLRDIIEPQPDLHVSADAADGAEAFMKLEQCPADIVLLDLSMPPGESGLITAKRILEKFPETRIIILTMHETKDYISQAFALGVSGYLLKSSANEEVLRAIHEVADGRQYLDSKLAGLFDLHANNEKGQPITSKYDSLSKREQEILPFVALGYGNKEIAEKLFVSVKTVEAHKSHLMKKLGLSSRVELIRFAIKNHLIDV